MVQVDVFWSYGLGASMALAAGRQLVARREIARRDTSGAAERLPGDPEDRASLWRNPFFLKTILYAALLFAPSGAYLLWSFPDWETMHAGDRGLAAWLVAAFAVTNVTQAMLGFWVVERLLRGGRRYAATLQVVAAYLAMLFILVHGWDGEGWQRFFSPDAADYRSWDGDWAAWLTSDVALTLAGMGAILFPVLFAMLVRWQTAGYALAAPGEARPGPTGIVIGHLALVFGVALGAAVGAHLLLAGLGTVAGSIATALLWACALAPRGPAHRLARALGWAAPRPRLKVRGGLPMTRGWTNVSIQRSATSSRRR
jgi:hypothetical protein